MAIILDKLVNWNWLGSDWHTFRSDLKKRNLDWLVRPWKKSQQTILFLFHPLFCAFFKIFRHFYSVQWFFTDTQFPLRMQAFSRVISALYLPENGQISLFCQRVLGRNSPRLSHHHQLWRRMSAVFRHFHDSPRHLSGRISSAASFWIMNTFWRCLGISTAIPAIWAGS